MAASSYGNFTVLEPATALWSLDSSVVGKVTDVVLVTGSAKAAAAGIVVTGTTYEPLSQISVIDVSSGTILSKATMQSWGNNPCFTNAVDASRDGARIFLMCADSQMFGIRLFMFGNGSVSGQPAYGQYLNGTMFWGAHTVHASADGSQVVCGQIYNRPQIVSPVPGITSWYDGPTGNIRSQRYQQLTLGEAWVDRSKGQRFAYREFDTDGEGHVETFPLSQQGQQLSTVLDKYDGVSVDPDVNFVFTPADTDVQTVQVFNTGDGTLAWQFTADASEALVNLQIGRKWAVGLWFVSSSNTFTARAFAVKQVGTPKPAATYSLANAQGIPAEDAPLLALSTDAAESDLFVAVEGQGIYYMNLAAPTTPPAQVLQYQDTCGFATLDAARSASGVVAVATLNQRVDSNTCQDSASVSAIALA